MSPITPERVAILDDLRADAGKLAEQNYRVDNRLKTIAGGLATGALIVVACSNGGDNNDKLEAGTSVESSTVQDLTTTEAEESTTSTTESEAVTTTTEAEESTTSTTEAEAVTTTTVEGLTATELEAKYGNIITGVTSAREVGQFEITTLEEEQSKENFYTDIRHNPQTLAFFATCLDQEVPNYENCADEDDAEGMRTLTEASELLPEVHEMDLEDKAELAEEVIGKFEEMDFDGVELHDGMYRTFRLKLDADGNVVGYEESTNNRTNDPRLHFSYVDKDGNVQTIEIRSCAQITEDVPTPTPTTTQPPTTTTVPEETTTTTTIPETTTTTTTTIPEKEDDGELPDTGTPADQDPGTPDEAGEGSAGQEPNDEGYIDSETPPSSQAPDTTQLPAPTTTENPVPATEGTAPDSTEAPVVIDDDEIVEDDSPDPEAPANPDQDSPENGTLPDPSSLGAFGWVLGGVAARRRKTNAPQKGNR